MRHIAKRMLLLTVIVVLAGCSGSNTSFNTPGSSSNPGNGNPSNAQILIAGFYSEGSKNLPCYWKITAGVANLTPLQHDDYNTEAYSVYFSNNTVYTAGDYMDDDGNSFPCYWRDYVKINLGAGEGHAQSIFVSGDRVYIAGFYNNGTKNIPCYWSNLADAEDAVTLQRVDLQSGPGDAASQSIYISGGVVYNAGFYNDGTNDIPCYWAGNVKSDLGTGQGHAQAIYGSGGAVYIAGYYNNGSKDIPCFWNQFPLNPMKKDLPLPSGSMNAYTWSLHIAGNSFYIAGYYNKDSRNIPCYWMFTSGIASRTDLPGGNYNAVAQSICHANNTVYNAGFYVVGDGNIPCYWIGGTKFDLDVPNNGSAEAQSIFVY